MLKIQPWEGHVPTIQMDHPAATWVPRTFWIFFGTIGKTVECWLLGWHKCILPGICGGDFCTSHLRKTGTTRWAHVPCPNHPRMILQNVLEVEEVQQISFDQETLHTPTSNICGSRAAQANWKSLSDSWLAIQPLPHPWQTCDLGISKFPRTTMEYPSTAAHSGTLQRRSGWHDDSPSWVLCSYAATAVHEAWQLRTLILPITFQKQPIEICQWSV